MRPVNSTYGQGNRFATTPTTIASATSPRPYLLHTTSSSKDCLKTKGNLFYNTDFVDFARMKRLKSKKGNGIPKMDLSKKKSLDYTEMAYREAVSKLKYLLAETYVERPIVGKLQGLVNTYQPNNTRINESGEDTDDRSIISDTSRTKDLAGNTQTFIHSFKNMNPSKTYSNLVLSAVDLQSIPPELCFFLERQEEYIEQLERESQFCREELTNLLSKVREVVAENEALHNKNKSGFLKYALQEHKHLNETECNKYNQSETDISQSKRHKVLEGPSIIFESRISELEAQLTQAKLELRKAQEENKSNLKRLSDNCLSNVEPEIKVQLEQALRDKYDAEMKVEDLQKSLSVMRDKEAETAQKAKRSTDAVQQVAFEKDQCEAEIRRLKEELNRQHDKLLEANQEANRRIAEERQQAERRYNQQVEQLSADAACHWDAASKSQLESEKQRRELTELKRELSQKQTFIDNLKKEIQNKISNLQSEYNQTIAEKDAAEQEILATKLAAERNERQSRQEQNRLQAEINSYKLRLERADADLVHCRRENLRLSEQIASLEKEINMNKAVFSEDTRTQAPSKLDNENELSTMIMDMETKHEGVTERDLTTVGKTTSTSNKKRTVKVDLKVKVIPKQKEEMASLQNNIEYLSNKIQDTLDQQKVESQGNYDYNTPYNSSMLIRGDTADHQIIQQEYDTTTTNEHTANIDSSNIHELSNYNDCITNNKLDDTGDTGKISQDNIEPQSKNLFN